MNRRRLNELLAGFPRVRALVVGDLMLDRFVWGRVQRISPEAPVPVVEVERESVHAGGAGNVVANLAALDAPPQVVGWVGRDAAGRRIRELLDGLGADSSGVRASGAAVTIEKTRIVAHSQQVVRLDREPTRPDEALSRRLRKEVETRVPRLDVVVVSDYAKGTIDEAMLARLAELRPRYGFLYLIDPKQRNFAHYRGATLVKPNELETSQATGAGLDGPGALAKAGRTLLSRWEAEAVLISRGEHGMALCRPGQRPKQFPAVAREVFDVTGAGDTVLSVAALTLAAGGTADEAASLANVAAGVVVGKVGTATVTRRELQRAWTQGDGRGKRSVSS